MLDQALHTSRDVYQGRRRALTHRPRSSCPPLFFASYAAAPSHALPKPLQQASSFVPSGLPALFGGVTARLVYRVNGLVDNWKDPTVQSVYLAGGLTAL